MSVQFETPENILLEYKPAGLGSRFIAFLIDWVFMLLPLVFLMGSIIYIVSVDEELSRNLITDENGRTDASSIVVYISTLYFVLLGILSVAYFGIFELFMRGQTPGKKFMNLRVVNTEGFRLQPTGIAVRSFFRVIDTLPPLWVIPFASSNSQRLGDIVGQTAVVYDTPPDAETRKFREDLFELNGQPEHIFSPSAMEKIPAQSLEAATRLLQRWETMPDEQQQVFCNNFCATLARHLSTPEPDVAHCPKFLLDLLLNEYLRQYRKLG